MPDDIMRGLVTEFLDQTYMERDYTFDLRADFSETIAGRVTIAASATANDEAVLLAVAPQFESIAFGREVRKTFATIPFSRSKQGYPATFYCTDGSGIIQKVELEQVEVAFPSIQKLPNQEILLVGARCDYRGGDPEKNAFVYGWNGQLRRRFVLGDGIQSVQTTADGKIWVSYFDEGVFGNSGWTQPMGAAGLICFDSAGHILWEFKPPTGFDSICDCYAMNVASSAVWACYYTEFPLVKIGSDHRVCGWKNEFGGARAVAVDDSRALLLGGYGNKQSRCVIQNIGQEALENPHEIEIGLPPGFDLTGASVVGRGSKLHAFTGNSWFTFDLRRVA